MSNEQISNLRGKAEQGDAEAQYNLGEMYDTGKGVPQDFMMARGWYERAAVQGHADAQSALGSMQRRCRIVTSLRSN